MFKIPHLRWLIAVALLFASVLNYIDRNVLGLLAPSIQADLKISDQQYAEVVSLFLAAYTLAYLGSGWIVDSVGVRLSMALFVGWWSISNALTGFARSFNSLSAFRFLLGLGEAGAFTAAPKAVSEWFPSAERGLAVGIYSIGGAIGATIAPLLVVHVASHFGWRAVFFVTPVLAWFWLVVWLFLYRPPARHPWLTEKERALLPPPSEPEVAGKPLPLATWREALSQSLIWRLMLARMMTDPVWYFYQFWMPKYLHAVHRLSQSQLSVLWLVFLAADFGFIGGGFFAGRLVKRGFLPAAARVTLMAVSACVVPLSFLIPWTPGLAGVIVLAMLVVGAHTSWLGNLTALVVDIVPKPILGTSFGVIACGSAIGGIFMNEMVAWLIAHWTYSDCFYLMALVHPVALSLLWKLRTHPCKT